MNTIRLVLNDELSRTLDFLRLAEYPALSNAEILKVAISREAIRAKRTKKSLSYDDSDLSPKEIMYQASKSFDIDNDDEPVFWDESNIKPIKLKNYV